jgi:hypothetical protein
MVIVFLAFAQSLGPLKLFFSGRHRLIVDYTAHDFLNALFAVSTVNPEAYQFWFIRDLMIMVVLAPLLKIVAIHWPLRILVIVALLTFWILDLRFFFSGAASPLFFYLGFLVSIKAVKADFTIRHGPTIVILFLLTVTAGAALKTFEMYMVADIIHRVSILLGVCGALYIGRQLLHTKLCEIMITLSPFSFFCFASHEPTLTIFSKILYRLLPPASSLQSLCYYFLLPLITITVTLLAGVGLSFCMPRFYSVITGSRSYDVQNSMSESSLRCRGEIDA